MHGDRVFVESSTAAVLPTLRQEAINGGLLRVGGVRSLVHIAGLVAAWAALIGVGYAAGTLWVWIPVWICVAFLFVGFGGVGHDSVHGTVVGSKLGNLVIGHAASAVLGLPFPVYRQYHLLHHADTLGDTDPEGPGLIFESKAQYAVFHVALGPGFLTLIWASALGGAARHPPKWARTESSRRVLRYGLFPGAIIFAAAIVASIESDTFRHVWLFPWLFLMVPVLAFALCGEHYGGRAEDGTLTNTYTAVSNPVTRFAVFNINFHTVHHLLPRVPSPSLHRMDKIAAPFEQNRHTGYIAFHRSVLAPLPWLAPPSAVSGSRLRTLIDPNAVALTDDARAADAGASDATHRQSLHT